MNKNQVKGKLKEVTGSAQARAGRASGDMDAESRGSAREVEGKVQKKAGDIKQGLKKIVQKP
jgi:uncharacterized protein YjbJ (UPF0337 family)